MFRFIEGVFKIIIYSIQCIIRAFLFVFTWISKIIWYVVLFCKKAGFPVSFLFIFYMMLSSYANSYKPKIMFGALKNFITDNGKALIYAVLISILVYAFFLLIYKFYSEFQSWLEEKYSSLVDNMHRRKASISPCFVPNNPKRQKSTKEMERYKLHCNYIERKI